ncbi:MAG: hypothetical protein ACKV2Q_36520 [Planctomycetaceae bacterium]
MRDKASQLREREERELFIALRGFREATERQALESLNLPHDYFEMTDSGKREARVAGLAGWYDPRRPDVVCNDVERYLRSHALLYWRYMKAWRGNQHIYYYAEPRHKYDMLRLIMGPPKNPDEPNMAAFHSGRHSGKTKIAVVERYILIGLARPRTVMLLTEITKQMNKKRIADIREQVETNELIHEDYGEKGDLWPKRATPYQPWSEQALYFMPTGAVIQGVAVGQKDVRGNRADVGTIDDIEDNKTIKQKNFKTTYFTWLIRTYTKIFKAGAIITWINTRVGDGSCMAAMLDCRSAVEGEHESYDPRLENWYRRTFKMIEDVGGKLVSNWPDHYSVDKFHKDMQTDRATTMAEMQGESMPEGVVALARDEHRHGYIRSTDEDGVEQFYDLHTRRKMPWSDFLATLSIFAGGDMANTTTIYGDYSAVVIIGIDHANFVYVLDVWIDRVHIDVAGDEAQRICRKWGAETIGWGNAGLQKAIARMWNVLQERTRAAEGTTPVIAVTVSEQGRGKKHARAVRTISPLLTHNKMRLPRYEPTDFGGNMVVPDKSDAEPAIRILKHQIDTQTDEENPNREDDAIDALELACYQASATRGPLIVDDSLTDQQFLENMDADGRPVERGTVPPELWPFSWISEAVGVTQRVDRASIFVMDPYDD